MPREWCPDGDLTLSGTLTRNPAWGHFPQHLPALVISAEVMLLQTRSITFQPWNGGVNEKYLALASFRQNLTFKCLRWGEVLWETSPCLGGSKVCKSLIALHCPLGIQTPWEAQPCALSLLGWAEAGGFPVSPPAWAAQRDSSRAGVSSQGISLPVSIARWMVNTGKGELRELTWVKWWSRKEKCKERRKGSVQRG